MVELFWISLPRGQARGHVIFVHGLGGHPVDTFQSNSSDPETFWPVWIARQFPDIAVWTLSYPAPPTNWSGHGLDIERRAMTVLQRIKITPEMEKGPIIFICHSLGGLVIKQMLRFSNENRANPDIARVLKRVNGIIFLGTPHGGSKFGSWASWLRFIVNPSDAVLEMTYANNGLKSLNDWFRNWNERPAALVFYETIATAFGRVVPDVAGDANLPGVFAYPVERDHFQICKPDTVRDAVFLEAYHFVQENMPRPRKAKQLAAEVLAEPASLAEAVFRTEPINVERQRIPLLPRIIRAALLAAVAGGVAIAAYRIGWPPRERLVSKPPSLPGYTTFTSGNLDIQVHPSTVVIPPGMYREVSYLFTETKGTSVNFVSQDVRWLRSDGSLIRSQPGNKILLGPFVVQANSTYELRDNVFLPGDIISFISEPNDFASLETTFVGSSPSGEPVTAKAVLRIHSMIPTKEIKAGP